ncbi:MAG TPA: hypothetical protein VI112_06370 [Bacteroidia bacterium]|jgi:hypothetical protein
MKKILLIAGLAVFALTAGVSNSYATVRHSMTVGENWTKSTTGTWEGMNDGKKTWYKLNPADASLWWSMDGKKWEASKNGMWQDKDGKWLKIDNKMLKWSADGGKTWSDVPDWKWQGSNGMWYKFDKSWSLWQMSAKDM